MKQTSGKSPRHFRALSCLSVSIDQVYVPTLFAACMKRISGRKQVVRRNGFRGKCQCYVDLFAAATLLSHIPGGAICLSAGQSPPRL